MILYNPTQADAEPTIIGCRRCIWPTEPIACLHGGEPRFTATFTQGEKAIGQGDVMAAFSSRGGRAAKWSSNRT